MSVTLTALLSREMYNRLFTKILDSSIWLQCNATRIVWMTLLAAMDEDGIAHFSALENLSSRARVALGEAQIAVDCFLAPDPESGDPEYDGRRIERIPGGYVILNAPKYRAMFKREIQREQTRLRVLAYRDRKKSVTQCNAPVTQCNDLKRSVTQSVSEAASEAGGNGDSQHGVNNRQQSSTENIDSEAPKPPIFAALATNLFRSALLGMLDDAKAELKKTTDFKGAYEYSLRKDVSDLINDLESKAEHKRAAQLRSDEANYKRGKLKPGWASYADAWKSRITDLKRALLGIVPDKAQSNTRT